MPISHPATGSLASRYRPRKFAEVVGQRHAKVPLQRAIRSGRLPQQILFSGGSGLGKTTLARICASALICQTPIDSRPDGDCCGECPNCLDVAAGQHPDVVEIDAASNGRVDEVRELAARAHFAPMRGSRRIYIIDEAHGLSAAGGQAFLKLLEEPPTHVVFMLATTDPEKMLHTNRSRCTEFELTAPTREELAANVIRVAAAEGVVLGEAPAVEIVAASPPELGLRGTLMALEKVLPSLQNDPLLPIADLLGVPSRSSMLALRAALSAGDAPGALSAFMNLRSRFALSPLLAALTETLHSELVNAVLEGNSSASLYLSAADALVAARRDGSDLAATVALLYAVGLDAPPAPTKPERSSAPAGVVDLKHPPKASHEPNLQVETRSDDHMSKEHTSKEHTSKESAASPEPAEMVIHSPINRTEETEEYVYYSDPWSPPLPPPTSGDLDPITTPQAPLVGLLGALSSQKRPASRLLIAALRGAESSFDSGVLVIRLPAPARALVERNQEALKEAASACGFEVQTLF